MSELEYRATVVLPSAEALQAETIVQGREDGSAAFLLHAIKKWR